LYDQVLVKTEKVKRFFKLVPIFLLGEWAKLSKLQEIKLTFDAQNVQKNDYLKALRGLFNILKAFIF